MTAKDTSIADPAKFVDEFSKVVNQWRLEREQWEKSIPEGRYGAWGMHSHFKAKLLGDLDRLFKLQDQINVMMLATLDERRRDDVS